MIRYETIRNNVLKMLSSGAAKQIILTYLAKEIDKILGKGSAVSILVLDETGLLRNAASPKLPDDYLKAIDGIKPHPKLGTCAAAAATGKIVITTNFSADDKWAELKHLPMSIGYSGAWSMPIKNKKGKVLGTIGTYYKNTREPSDIEIKGAELISEIAFEVLVSCNPEV